MTPRRTAAAERILDIAEKIAQMRGFNGFSYADIAAELAVTKASLHYHFPSKAALGRALIARYRVTFTHALDAIDGQARDARDKLKRYVKLYDGVLRNDRMCLCGMFAAEYATLPQPMQQELRSFFDANEQWLTRVLESGREAGELFFREAARERARVLLGSLEGAMLVARSYSDGQRFRAVAEHVLSDLNASAASKATPRRRTARKAHARR